MPNLSIARGGHAGPTSRVWLIGTLLLLLVHLVWGMLESSFVVSSDGAEYVQLADNLRHLGRFTYDGVEPVVGKPPGLPVFIAFYQSVVGSLTGFHFVQLLFLFGAYLFMTAIIRNHLGLWPALAVLAFLVAIDPFRRPTANALTEPLFLFLTSVGMWATVQFMVRRTTWHVGLAAFACASATYVRPVGFFWPLALFVMVLILCRPALLRQLFTLLALHVVLVAPWVVRNSRIMEQPVPFVANWQPMYGMSEGAMWTTFWHEGWGGIFRQHSYEDSLGHQFPFNPEPAKRLLRMTKRNISMDISGFVARGIKQLCQVWSYIPGTHEWEWRAPVPFWLGRGVMLGFYGLCILGATSLWKTSRPLVVIGLGYGLYTAAIHFPVTTESRYLLCAYLWLLPLAAAGIMRVVGAIGKASAT